MIVKEIKGKTNSQIRFEISQGAKFVYFEYCLPFLMHNKKTSRTFYVQAEKSVFYIGLLFSLISLLFGWWSFPFGPIYTVQSIISNFRGGKNITNQVYSLMEENQSYLNTGYLAIVHPKQDSKFQRNMRMTKNAFNPWASNTKY